MLLPVFAALEMGYYRKLFFAPAADVRLLMDGEHLLLPLIAKLQLWQVYVAVQTGSSCSSHSFFQHAAQSLLTFGVTMYGALLAPCSC